LLYVLFLGSLVPLHLCVVLLEWLISKYRFALLAVRRAIAVGLAGRLTRVGPPEQMAEQSVAEQEGRW
jgi:hypothetical protein